MSADLGIQLLKLKIFEQLGESQQLESLLRRLIKFHPEQIAFQKQLIKFYVDQHRHERCRKGNSGNGRGKSDQFRSRVGLGTLFVCDQRTGRSKSRNSIARINAGGEVFPYQIALADFDFSQGNFADAEQRIQNLVSHASSAEQTLAAQIKLAEMDFKRSKIDAAEAIVSEILRKDSRNTDALKMRGFRSNSPRAIGFSHHRLATSAQRSTSID